MKRDYSSLIWGIAIVLAGVIFGGNALDIWNIDIFFDGWWTLFLIIPGLSSILRYGFNWGSGILVIIGLVLLLDRQEILDSSVMWSLVFPFILVAFGISIIASFFRRDKSSDYIEVEEVKENEETYQRQNHKNIKYDKSQYPEYRAFFGGGDIINNSDNLKGVYVEAIFAGFDIDLRGAKITEDIELEVKAIFGGVDILVPQDVEIVIISGAPIFGALSYRKNRSIPGAPRIKVKYITAFGGADIK